LAAALAVPMLAMLCAAVAVMALGAASALAKLPDNRTNELVSTIPGTEVFPPAAGQSESFESALYGEPIANVGGFRAGASGEAVGYIGGLPPSGEGGFGVGKNYNGNLYLSVRGARRWEASDIEPAPYDRERIAGFSADLSRQFFNIAEPRFAEEHSGPQGCAGRAGGLYSRTGGVASYQSLAPSAPASFNECRYISFAGISADSSHILVQSPGAYTPGAAQGKEGSPEPEEIEGFDNLYDSVGGQLHQVNVLPDGTPQAHPAAVAGGSIVIRNGVVEHNFATDVSTDGTRVFWTDLNSKNLYVRENDDREQSRVEAERCTEPSKACTVQLDAAEASCIAKGTCESGGGVFWAASGDGAKAFFTDCHRLTEVSTAVNTGECKETLPNEDPVPTGADLYQYDFAAGRVTDLTVDHNAGDAVGANVQGVVGASEDGSYVYFVATGVLAGENGEARNPVAGQPNLYVSHNGTTRFIATLEREDNAFLGTAQSESPGNLAGDWRAQPGLRAAGVASSGGAIAFMSRLSLTGYDNVGIRGVGGEGKLQFGPQPEVFVYQNATGRIVCASCTPTGEAPLRTAEGWENGVGGHLGVGGSSTFGLRFINGQGTQVYFDTSQPLVAADSNHRQDVYEWQSNGSGGCMKSLGCVALLSGGDSVHDAYFLDASASGSDVFFTSREILSPQASDEATKLYDARVDGGFPEFSLTCTGAGCQGVPPAPPSFATPSSVTFNGVGNFSPAPVPPKAKSKTPLRCRKGFVKRKGKCVRQHRVKRKSGKGSGNSTTKGRK
jgi:hypothetical protein